MKQIQEAGEKSGWISNTDWNILGAILIPDLILNSAAINTIYLLIQYSMEIGYSLNLTFFISKSKLFQRFPG